MSMIKTARLIYKYIKRDEEGNVAEETKALDDVNIDRFARFIKEYAEKTQFIIISHRKGTMEAADVLYGVAMENKGVSRLMSVKVSDYA